MYNNIGLLTPRGSGTSGHVTKNNFGLPASHLEWNNPAPANSATLSNSALKRKSNQEILEHNKKRKIESKVLELED